MCASFRVFSLNFEGDKLSPWPFFKGTIPIAVRDWRNGAAWLKPWIPDLYAWLNSRYYIDLKYLYEPKLPFMEAEKMDNIIWHHYNGFPMEWCLRKEYRNSTLLMHHYPDLGSGSDWSKHIFFSQSESLPRCEYFHVISMEFLSVLVLHTLFGGKTIMVVSTCTWSLRQSMTDYQS